MSVTILKAGREKICRAICKNVKSAANLPALNKTFAKLKYPTILGGNIAKKNSGRFSLWMAEPKEVFEITAGQSDPFEKLRKILNKYKLGEIAAENPPAGLFVGGWAGFFSYELGRFIEKLPEKSIDDLRLPLIRLCFYDKVLAYDHQEDEFRLTALQLPTDTEEIEEKITRLERILRESEKQDINRCVYGDIEEGDFSQIRSNMTKDYYLKSVEKIKRHIYDGDVYQVNFSQRFECNYRSEPVELFNWQNQFNPCGYAAYIDAGDFSIVSASPEMFLTKEEEFISTKPIKGTRPRVADSGAGKELNERNYNELVNSQKEQAELNMIIDLERNDLAKICEPGSREVIQSRTIEEYPTVFHAVATIKGQVKTGMDFCDILRATFPGGSITGAPKVSAMEIIDRLEPTQRAVYTGSIGFIGVDGNACLNIAIRTIIIKNGKAFVQSGGGIVADSEPEAEWNETLVKAKALLAGIRSASLA
jgi:para-aminobenzoate synthetase component 1